MRLFFCCLILSLLLGGCGMKNSRSSGSFAYDSMINFNNNIYVGTTEEVKDIGKQIGKVEVYSTNETDETNRTFSNKYQKGTKLYSVNGDKVENVIAVEIVSNSYIKAYNLNYKTPGIK
jgi:hypothetical protein